MAICKNCRFFDDETKDGYKRYCTTYKEYVDPDSKPYDCTRYESGYSSESGGCYLTTACIKAKNLPDDCVELQTLRNFRDNYVAKTPGGTADIEHYYATAPEIVNRINTLKNAKDFWKEIYEKLVLVCTDLINKSEFEEAYSLYKSYSLKLEKEFLNQ